jgi:hypothetical protein
MSALYELCFGRPVAAVGANRLCEVNGERREAVLRQLELFRADAEGNERAQQLGSMSYAYPQSLGEWLGTAVQIAATVSWQAHFALRPLALQTGHERRIAEQGRAFIELYGALLVGALAACDAALEREVAPELQVDLPEIDSVLEVWDEARDERNGLVFSITALGEAIWIYGTCRDRNAALLPTISTKLLEATGFAALALAVADEP